MRKLEENIVYKLQIFPRIHIYPHFCLNRFSYNKFKFVIVAKKKEFSLI